LIALYLDIITYDDKQVYSGWRQIFTGSRISHPLLNKFTHSQTFENKSSLAAKPVAGFAGAAPCPWPTVGAEGAALHPPKSSSAVTFGGA